MIDAARDDWKADAKSVRVEDECARRGIRLRGNSVHRAGPCPRPGCAADDDGFSINTRKQVFRCRQCNSEGGDVIAMVRWLDDCDFNEACEKLAGKSPPNKEPNGARRGNGHDSAAKAKASGRKEPVATYRYTDEHGRELFSVVRFHFRLPDGSFELGENGKPKKSFGQKRPAPDGEPKIQIWGLGAGEYCRRSSAQDWGSFTEEKWAKLPPASRERKTFPALDEAARRTPYRLPDLVASLNADRTIPVLIVEGEGKVDLLIKLGFAATCCAEGAGKWTGEHAKPLIGADCVILPDNDDSGRKHRDVVARSLVGIAAHIRVLTLPGLGEKDDVKDWLARGSTREQLQELIDEAPEWQPGDEPPPSEDSVDKPAVRVIPGLIHKTATEAETALIARGAPFYSRGGMVVRPIVEEVVSTRGFKTMVARARQVSPDCMLDHLSRSARFERYDARSKKFVAINPPRDVALTILSRDGEWSFPPLAGLITTQTLRPDGSILDVPGYDRATRLLLLDPPPLPPIPDKPSRDDGAAALGLLKDLLKEFPFSDAESLAVALSGLMTPVVRGAMAVAPLHGVDAPAPASGKSYLVDLCSAIATGQKCVGITAGRDEAETEKRLVGAAVTADQIISIDNLNGELGGDFLCQLVERTVVKPRILGGNSQAHMPRIESRTTVFANGNNITPRGDIIRRTITCSLDTNMEKPYEREFKDNPLDRILADRGKYIAAAITIVRAYLAAGEPAKYTPLASFEEWSRMVRAPLMWLGEADPVKTIETTREEDPELILLAAVIVELKKLLGDHRMTAGEIKDAANEREEEHSSNDAGRYRQAPYRRPELRQALIDAAGIRGEIDTRRLGGFLKRYKGRIFNGMKLVTEQDRSRKQQTWGVNGLG
jgi:putative DNA primase/helicase